MRRFGARLLEILKPLEELGAEDPSALEKLEASLGALKALQKAVWKLRAPKIRTVQARLRSHLSHLIKWNEHLLKKRGIDPEAAPRRLKRTRGLHLLGLAKRYEVENPNDRIGVAERWVRALEALRGSPEEREIVARLNALWDEVSDGAVADVPDVAPPEPPVADNRDRPKPSTPSRPEPDPAAKPESPPNEKLDADTLKALRSVLTTGSAEQRVAAAKRLAGQKATWLGSFLTDRLLKERDPAVRVELNAAVRSVADRYVARALTRWAKLKEPKRRIEAIRILAVIDHAEAGKSLRAFSKDADLKVQRAVLEVGKKMPEGRGIAAIARLMESRPVIRPEAILALGESRHEDAAPVLVSFLHRRKFMEEKPQAISAFRSLGPVAVPALIRALDATDYRQHAAAALRAVSGQRFGISATRWKQWWRKNRKRLLAGRG